MKIVKFFILLFIVAGAINWGFWGIFQYDFIADILGGNTTGWARLAYSIVGICGVLGISFFFIPEIYTCCCKKNVCAAKKEKEDE